MSTNNPGEPASVELGNRAWNLVAATGLQNVVPSVLNRKDQFGTKEQLELETIWEEPEIAQKLLAQRATNIIQNALFPNTILFQFKADDFVHHTDAYKLLEEKIGKLAGARPITKFGIHQRKDLIVEAKFVSSADSTKAVKEGLTFKGIQYKGSPSNDGANDKVIRLSLSQLPPFATKEELTDGLCNSLRTYGRVCQVKRYTNRGYFEGEAVVLLDTSSIAQATWQPLERRLYLDTWNIFVPASFRGAPPICFACRQSGHIRRSCPMLANITCYKCRGKGHIARRCRNEPQTEAEALDKYLELTQREKENLSQTKESSELAEITDEADILEEEDLLEEEEVLEKEEIVEEEEMSEEENKDRDENMEDAESSCKKGATNFEYKNYKSNTHVKVPTKKGRTVLQSAERRVLLQQKKLALRKKQDTSDVTRKTVVALNNTNMSPSSNAILSGQKAYE
ncbi:hypothetical protein EC973_007331 [Apophysomyces ossiformis]|uniref:CCHC-type domain-containing protein n=1 Tax=Apophysomyces ossiformis TaxID=679940 RepID=A0A8H7EKV8_9FUNG|nr:hypothetical protein EC973_007331 [Apophysomyces ossiformis]